MKSLKKALTALIDKDGSNWDLHLPAVALAYISTPQSATGWFPFFLCKGREAFLPVQRHLDEPWLDPISRKWLSRLWKSRIAVVEAQLN